MNIAYFVLIGHYVIACDMHVLPYRLYSKHTCMYLMLPDLLLHSLVGWFYHIIQ